jgi:hypothetical protein
MKTSLKTLSLITILAVSIFGCSKKSTIVPDTNTPSTWTISGNTYKGTTTAFTNNELLSVDGNDNTQPDIGIQFSTRPTANGTYTVVDQLSTTIGANQCSIETSNGSGSGTLFSYNGGTVTITINNGKITAAYTAVDMGSNTGFNTNTGMFTFADAGTTTGKIIEQ